jgi:hypothetical protein
MDRAGFSEFLTERGFDPGSLDRLVGVVERFAVEAHEGRGAGHVEPFAAALIEEGSNSPDVFWALALYGRFTGDHSLTAAVLSFADGAEALGNLHARLGEELGAPERDRVFAGIDLPPLGTPATELPAFAQRVMERLEAEVDPGITSSILSECLRDLDDAWYADARAHFEEHGDVDALLRWRRESLMEVLEECRREGRPWFAAEITDEVLEYVRAHPEVSSGRRDGDTVVEVKIPHQTKEWLAATDDGQRRYHYCHCPWAKESLLRDDVTVPAAFCACSAGFHKRFWEVVLDRPLQAEIRESVLAGDDRCTIAIRLPADVVPDDRSD